MPTQAPHRNWLPAPSKLQEFEGVRFPEPPTLFDDYENRATPARKQTMEIDRHMTLGSDLKVVGDGADLRGRRRVQAHDGGTAPHVGCRLRAPEPRVRERKLQGKELVRWKYQQYMQDYLGCVASVDDSVGRLLNWLDATGEADNTLVIYSSDPGLLSRRARLV